MVSMYSEWDAKDMTPIPVEDIPEFNDAYKFYKDGVERGLIINYKDPTYSTLFSSGRLGSMLQSGAMLHSIYSVPRGFNYSTYTLYPDKLYQVNLSSESLVINANSTNAERVILFVEWLESNQENYDLLMYGIKDKQYSLNGNKLDICDNYNDFIFDWTGSGVFRNYLYERPYFFEPENYKEFLEKNMKDNTENYIKTFEKHGYNISKYFEMNREDKAILNEDQNSMSNLSNARSKLYNNYIEQIRNGDFSKTLSAYMAEAGGKENVDKLMDYFITYMNKFK